MATFDVNTDASIELTAKLEKLHKSAFPSAVRNTLNAAAFDMKKNIPLVASGKFITRNKSFFNRMTVVEKANGFSIKNMKSTTGIDAKKDPKLANNLASQDTGGMVSGRKLIPHDDARVSKSHKKQVSRRNYINRVNYHNSTKAFKAHRGTRNSKFVSAIYSMVKSGKKHMMLGNSRRGIVYEVTGVSQNRTSRNVNFKLRKIYVNKNTRSYKANSNRFMAESKNMTIKKIPEFYRKNAEFQFKKYLR